MLVGIVGFFVRATPGVEPDDDGIEKSLDGGVEGGVPDQSHTGDLGVLPVRSLDPGDRESLQPGDLEDFGVEAPSQHGSGG